MVVTKRLKFTTSYKQNDNAKKEKKQNKKKEARNKGGSRNKTKKNIAVLESRWNDDELHELIMFSIQFLLH